MWSLEYVQQPDESTIAAAASQDSEGGMPAGSEQEEKACSEKGLGNRYSSSDQLQAFREDFSAEALRQRLQVREGHVDLKALSVRCNLYRRMTITVKASLQTRRDSAKHQAQPTIALTGPTAGLERRLQRAQLVEMTKATSSWLQQRLLSRPQRRPTSTALRRLSCDRRSSREISGNRARPIRSSS